MYSSPNPRSGALLIAAVLAQTLWIAACGSSGGDPRLPDDGSGDQLDSAALRLDEMAIRASRDGDVIRVEVPVEALGERAVVVEGSLEVRHTNGEVVVRVDEIERLVGEDGVAVERGPAAALSLVGESGVAVFELTGFEGLPTSTADSGALASYVIHVDLRGGSSRVSAFRSLYEAWVKQDIRVFSTDRFDVGGRTYVRVLAADPDTGAPLVGVPVALGFEDEAGAFVELHAGVTDQFGSLAAPVVADEAQLGGQDLVAEVGGADAREVLRAAVSVEREQRVMITTDKPLYQPGQTIHIRTLTLNRPSLAPAAGEPVLLEVKDGEGNKVGRLDGTADAFGVAAFEFNLARELNMGTWTLVATIAGVSTERAVSVERYTLPTFEVKVTSDRRYYAPGDTAQLFIDSRYFFGEPVSGGLVTVQPYTFDVGFTPLPPVEAALDQAGLARVDVRIPEFLVGLPLEQGGTFIRADISVTDGAQHTETVTRNLTVAQGDVLVTVVPSTALVPGVETDFYVLTSDPTGVPLSASVALSWGDTGGAEIQTNDRGYGAARIKVPEGSSTLTLTVSVTAEAGSLTRSIAFDIGSAGVVGAIALSTDRAVYSVGESVEVSIVAPMAVPRVFLDVVRSGQTLAVETIELTAGRARHTVDLSADMTGTLRFEAYMVTTEANIVRSDALVLVEDATGLEIRFDTDRGEYRPGEEAQLTIGVTNGAGDGVQAAVGLTIVDEAVFALQDMRPGLERVYFQLEEEILNPAYNLYGISFESVLAPTDDPVARDESAGVLLAATETGGYPIALSTIGPAESQAQSTARTEFGSTTQRVAARFRRLYELGEFRETAWSDAAELSELIDKVGTPYDPWGQPMRVEPQPPTPVVAINVLSAGLDEIWESDDDLVRSFSVWELTPVQANDDGFGGADAGVADAGGVPEDNDPEPPSGEDDAPRVRQYFPETLLVAPSIVTDEDGHAMLPVALADSITTWRVTGTANTQTGELGSGSSGIRVFQEFFVDIDFPVSLTQNDSVSVPIALYNYLETAQQVELRVDLEESGDWFALTGSPTQTATLEPGEVTVRFFDVTVRRVGRHPFQVTAIGSSLSDAVRRVVEVVPDGQMQLVTLSDRLVENVEEVIDVPASAIDEASSLFVKLYPGLFSQVLEGLDSLLQMPSGCFEQTSSMTYPNILVMQYLTQTDQSSPEIELLATEYISQGYQRLVSYEVPGGGFEWFGQDPAHRILTAYGLLEFSDMAEVFPVDPAVIERTKRWLIGQQEADGRWRAAPEGIHEGATNNFTDSDLRATSYITYSLIESGETGADVSAGLAWIRANLDGVDDPYTLGMVANTLLAFDRSDSTGRALVARLDGMKRVDDSREVPAFWWESPGQSLYYGSGEGMNMETTALILQAFIRAGSHPETVDGVVGYLIRNKGEFGNFSSTQATINTLRAFLMLLSDRTTSGAAEIGVYVNGVLAERLSIDEASSDLLRLVDLSSAVVEGPNTVEIEVDGEGQFLYQIVGRYYLPWEDVAPPSQDVLTIDVSYDRTELAVDETVGVTAVVENHTDARLDMVMIDLGVPPGFDVQISDFDAAIAAADNPVTRVDRAGRQLTVYLYGLDPFEVLTLNYHLRATMPLEAATPASAVWLYYDADTRSEEAPVVLTVR